MTEWISRRLSQVLRQRLDETPVLMLEGPRSVGKSTLLAELAPSEEQMIFDLDQAQFRLLAEQNATALVGGVSPVLIDEYQRVPSLLDAIKARLNRETRPGMFVLAGSASYDSLPKGTQALTGRIQRLPVMPFTQAEIDGTDNKARLGANIQSLARKRSEPSSVVALEDNRGLFDEIAACLADTTWTAKAK